MERHEYDVLYGFYQQNPYAFSSDQADHLQRFAQQYQLPFQRSVEADDFDLGRALKQLGAGFFSGFTTLQVGDAPENVAEGIARSIGTLLGFVGFIPGPGMIGKFGATAIGRAIGMGGLAKIVGTNARLLPQLKSLPMYIGEKAVAHASAIGSVRTFFEANRIGQAAQGALHLGAASAASSWQQGVDEMVKAFAFGAAEGGGFRLIANYMDFAKLGAAGKTLTDAEKVRAAQANMAVRGLASSLYSGLPSTLRSEPLPMQVYEYLLGAYFGLSDPSYERVRAFEFMRDRVMKPTDGSREAVRDRMLNITKVEGYKDLDPDVQDLVRGDAGLWWGRRMALDIGEMTSGGAITAAAYDQVWHDKFNEALREGKTEEEAADVAGRKYYDIQRWHSRYQRGRRAGMDFDQAMDFAGTMFWREEKEAPKAPEAPQPPADAAPGEQPTRMSDEAQRVAQGQREALLDHDLPISLHGPLESFVRQIVRDNPAAEKGGVFFRLPDGSPATGEDIAHSIVGIFGRHVDKGEAGWQNALNEIHEAWGTAVLEKVPGLYARGEEGLRINEDAPAWRSLRRAWKMRQAMDPKEKVGLALGRTGILTYPIGTHDLNGNRVDEKADAPLIEQAGHFASLSTVVTGKDGTRVVYENPFENPAVGFAELFMHLDAKNTPFFAAVKDRGELKLSDGWRFATHGIQVKTDAGYELAKGDPANADDTAFLVEMKLEALERVAPGAREARDEQLKAFAEVVGNVQDGAPRTPEEIRALYDRWWLNNIAIIEDLQGGIPYERMVEANAKGEGQFLVKAGDLTKRMQVISDGSPRFSAEFYRDLPGVENDALRFVIVNAVRRGGNRETAEGIKPIVMKRLGKDAEGKEITEEYLAEHHMDGVFFLRSDVFDRLLKDGGLSAEAGTAKGTVIFNGEANAKGEPLGMMIGKFAYFRADKHIDQAMLGMGDGIHAIMLDTAAKQRGFRKAYDYKVMKDGSVHLYTPGSDNPNPWGPGTEIHTMPLEGMRINASSSEDPAHMLEDTRVVRQFMANLMDDAAIERYMQRYVVPSFEGDAETNQHVERFLATRDERLVDLIDPQKMGLQQIMDVVTGQGKGLPDSPLYRKVWAHILNAKADPDDEEGYDGIGEAFRELDTTGAASNRIISILGKTGAFSPVHIRGLNTEAYTSAALRKYIVDRVLRPYADSSGQGILQPMDPWFQHALKGRTDLMPGAVKGGILQPGYFMLGDSAKAKKIRWLDGEKIALGKAFDKYMNATDAAQREEMERLLTFAVIRVPADSLSGTRMLKFAGFSGRRGAGITVHNRELIYLGGADLDIDKVFYYQDPDGPAVKSHSVERIISGGQTGADRGGLEAGRELGIKTGGTAPPRFMTQKGTDYALRDVFGLTEGEADPQVYPKRTRKNVDDSDGTVWFGNPNSPGGKQTLGHAKQVGKPVLINPDANELRAWLSANKIRVLNVAGNREEKTPGIHKLTQDTLREALSADRSRPIHDHIDAFRDQWDDPRFPGEGVIMDSKSMRDVFVEGLTKADKHPSSIGDPRLLFRAGQGAYLGNRTIGIPAVLGRRIQTLYRTGEVSPENFLRFSMVRRQAMNFAADAANDVLKLDADGVRDLLLEAAGVKLSKSKLGKAMSRVDALANGRVPGGKSKDRADLWQTLDGFKAFARDFPDALPNAWYRSLQMLGRLEYTKIGQKGSERHGELLPYVGRQWETDLVPRTKRIVRMAKDGDPLATMVLESVLRSDISIILHRMTNEGELAYLGGKRQVRTEAFGYDREWRGQQDIADGASISHIYEAAQDALAAGHTLEHLRAIGLEVTRLKDGRAQSIKHGKDAEPYMRDAARYRNALPPTLRPYFDAYMLGTMYPQPDGVSYKEFMALREKEFGPRLEQQRRREAERAKEPYKPLSKEALAKVWIDKGHKEAKEEFFRTNQQALGFMLDVIPDASIQKYLDRITELTQATWREKLTPEERERVGVLADPHFDVKVAEATGRPEDGELKAIENEQFALSFMEKIPFFKERAAEFMDPAVVGAKEAKQNRQLYEEAQAVLRAHPEIREHFEDAFNKLSAWSRPFGLVDRIGVDADEATHEELKHFLRFFVDVSRGRILNSTKGGDGGEGGLPFTQWAHIFFPDTIARWFVPYDLQVGQKVTRPVITSKGIQVKEVRDIFTTFGKAHEIANFLQQAKSAETENYRASFQFAFDWIAAHTRGDAADLIDMAVATRERSKWSDIFAKKEKAFDGEREYMVTLPDDLAAELFDGRQRVRLSARELAVSFRGGESIINRIVTARYRESRKLLQNHDGERQWLVTDNDTAYDPSAAGSYVNPYKTLKKLIEYVNRTGKVPNFGVEGALKIAHEMFLREKALYDFAMDDGSKVTGTIRDLLSRRVITRAQAQAALMDLREKMPYSARTEEQWIPPDVYWAHNNHNERALKKHFVELVQKYMEQGLPETNARAEVARLRWAAQRGYLEDAGVTDFVREVLWGKSMLSAEDRLEFKPPSLQSRGSDTLPGWDRTLNAIETYERQAINAFYNALTAAYGHELAHSFRNNKALAEKIGPRNVEPWAKFLDLYFHSILPGPSLYPQSWLSDEGFGLKRSVTFKVSDHQVERMARRADKRFFGGSYFGDEEPKVDGGAIIYPRGRSVIGDVRSRQFQARLAWWTQLEGKLSLMSLLASTKAMTNNMVGGNSQTIISTGFRNWLRAGDITYLRSINPAWKTMEDVTRDAERIGAIESWIVDEVHIPGFFRSGTARRFFDEGMAAIRKDPSVRDETLIEIAKKHGFDKTILDGAAWFMRSVERRLRRRAAIAHYLKAREALEATGAAFAWDDPWLLDIARKGVQATQFLYDNVNRPAFARTNLGRVLTRFQLWTWNSIRFRRDVYAEARDAGYRMGSPEAERFARMVQIDMFVGALATIFPASLFDNVLPSPWNYLQEFALFFFGDEEERDKAFFGTIPYPFSPVQVALPPVSRYFTTTFGTLLSGEWDRFASYHVWAFFPFGLAARSVYRTAENPVMIMENMTGFPLHRIHRELREHREEESLHANF
jgi:hypothetical protein